MLSSLALASVILAPFFAKADPNPTEPSGLSVFNEGETCLIRWDPDTTGEWTTMNIQLMTGSNLNMVHITTVATVDGTDAENNSYEYPCPAVEPNSKIYFYQFSTPTSETVYWTTRFTIASADGDVTDPTDVETNAAGEEIEWGTGALEQPGDAVPAPEIGGGTSSSSSRSVSDDDESSSSSRTRSSTSASGSRTSSSSSSSSTATGDSQDGAASVVRPILIPAAVLAAVACFF